MNTITRKIQIIINDDLNYKDIYKKLYEWQEITFRAYNYVSSHLFIQSNLDEFFYFNEGFRLKFTTEEKDPEGILLTSKQNTTYQLLSSKFKGDIPTNILACINSNVVQTFNKEKKEYFSGKRSLRSYKRTVPIPFASTAILNITPLEDNYSFSLFGHNFKTNFGRDLSGNKLIFDRSLSGDYKLCQSSLQLVGTKIFMLATFQFESDNIVLDKSKQMTATLDLNYPIIATIKNKKKHIGTKEEFVHRRLQIQNALHRTQKAMLYNNGGKGRVKKLKKLEEWNDLERNYIKTKLHTYSKMLIDFCVEHKAGTLILKHNEIELVALDERIKEIKKDESLSYKEKADQIDKAKFVLRNWSWNGLETFINYKAKIANIDVFFEK